MLIRHRQVMDARRLRYFVAVAQLGSFSAAARRLHIAQPALSRHVKALEGMLGVALLVRDARGVSLTHEGEELLAHAVHVLEQLDMLPRLVGPKSLRVAGRVVVGLPTSAGAVIAVPLLQAAIERYPNVRIHLIESLSGYLQEWIESGRLDLAVVYDPKSDHPGVRIDPILVEDLWLVGGPQSLPGLEFLPLRELPRFPLVVPGASHSHRRLLESVALSHGVRLDIRAEVDSLTVLKRMAAGGDVYAILAHGAVQAELADGSLHAARLVEPSISRSVALASSLSRSDNQACHAIARLTLEVSQRMIEAGTWRGRADLPTGT
jgi:LysR family nitrogen assimilation transcriptional regulator